MKNWAIGITIIVLIVGILSMRGFNVNKPTVEEEYVVTASFSVPKNNAVTVTKNESSKETGSIVFKPFKIE